MDIEVNHYSHGLARAVQGHSDNAKALIKAQLERYEKKPAKGHNYRTNYYTLDTALYGILDRDEARFNEGVKLQLMFYQGYARGEGKNTTFEFICDHSVALANLGIHQGLPVTVEHDTLPKGLLIQE